MKRLPRELRPETIGLGATRHFPEGMLNPDDEGELRFGVAHDDKGLVHMNFGKPVTWFALHPEQAIELAKLILRHAGARKVEITL
jgi:hypothetical protein